MSGVYDALILAAVAVLTVLALRRIKKSGGGCGGNCADCGAQCARRQENKEKKE